MEKGIRNADAVVCKLGPVSTRAANQRLEFAREERQKREEIVERRKTKAIVAKRWRARGGMSLSSEEEENYESDIGDETDQTKPTMMKIYYNSEKKGLGEATSDDLTKSHYIYIKI